MSSPPALPARALPPVPGVSPLVRAADAAHVASARHVVAEELADALGVTAAEVESARAAGRLDMAAVPVGGAVLYNVASARRLLRVREG